MNKIATIYMSINLKFRAPNVQHINLSGVLRSSIYSIVLGVFAVVVILVYNYDSNIHWIVYFEIKFTHEGSKAINYKAFTFEYG